MKTEPLIYFGRTVTESDMEDHARGLELIQVLNLKVIKSGAQAGRIATEHGTKYPCGLARTIADILRDK